MGHSLLHRFWAWPWELAHAGVLGINARNVLLVSPLNPRRLYPRVDDKVLTKQFCQAHGVPVPHTYAAIERFGEVRDLPALVARHPEFVIKPASGAGGRGIVVIAGHDGKTFRTPGGRELELSELRYHVGTVLSGLYSLGGQSDRAIIEERIVVHPIFERVAVGGTPDLRIICHQAAPVAAMLRLPTNQSRGRANLHQGAVGVGVDIDTGLTSGGVWHNRAIGTHPDTGADLQGLHVPQWPEAVSMARRLSAALELGYFGVDIVLDVARGPVVLEANARPGLAIQIANQRGLLPALRRGAGSPSTGTT